MRRILILLAGIALTASAVWAENAPPSNSPSARGPNFPTSGHGPAYPGTRAPSEQAPPLEAQPGNPNDKSTASTLKIMCGGNLSITRTDGVTLGQCDLNFIPLKKMSEIENICGIPGTIDSPAQNQCSIRAVVSPISAPSAHGKLYTVLEVLSVGKR